MIKAVFFDLGKVLVDFDWKVAARKLADKSDRPLEEILYVCTGSDLALRFERGQISTDDFLKALKHALQFREDHETLANLWSDIFTPVGPHITILEALSHTHIVGLISNTNALHFDHVERKFRFTSFFQRLSLSHRVGAMKPDTAIFKHAVEPFDLRPEEIVFIDDLEKNLAGAITLGWKTIHLTAEKNLEKELANCGVKAG